MPAKIFKNKNCIKLVCGAGNEDCSEVENLVMLYSKSGCEMFDISANIDVLKSAKRGILRSGITEVSRQDFDAVCRRCGIDSDSFTQADLDRLHERLNR